MPSERDETLMALQESLFEIYSRPIGDVRRGLMLLFRVNGAVVPYVTTHYDFTGFLLPGKKPRNLCFQYNGIAFADVETPLLDDNHPIDLMRPSLLLYHPNGRLIGCGFVRRSTGDPKIFGKPLRGVGPDEWFIHPAGWHTITGDFVASSDGGWPNPLLRALHTAISVVAPGILGFVKGAPGAWHHEYWDLHIFFNLDEHGRSRGPAIVARTNRSEDVRSPPNPPHAEIAHLLDDIYCPNGVPTHGMYEDHHAAGP